MAEQTSTSDAADRNWLAFTECYDITKHDKYIELADKCDEFYVGEQWDEDTLAKLGDRPALTINMSAKTMDAILGHYTQTRADIVVKPRKGATEMQAHTLTRLIDAILDNNNYQHVEGQVFSDGIFNDRGYFDVRLGFDDNILGDAVIKSRDPRTVILDANASEYDPATWTQVIVSDWFSPNEIKTIWGEDAATNIEAAVHSSDHRGTKSVRFVAQNADNLELEGDGGVTIEGKRIRSVRVIDRQHRMLDMVKEFVDLATGDTRVIPEGWDPERVQVVAQEYGLGIRKRLKSRVRWTVSVDRVTLFDDWSPYDDFTIVPFFPHFRRGRPSGIMRHLLSPQEQLNKTESQELHIVNTTANSGWTVEEGSLANMDEEDLEANGAQTGLVLVYKRNRPEPKKIQPNQVPAGISQIAGKAASYVQEISGTAPLVAQVPKSDVSGVTVKRQTDLALTGLQSVFDNLKFSRYLLGKRLVEIIQKFYTEPRVMRAVNYRTVEQQVEELAINTDMLNNVTLGKYDVVVSSAPARDTQDEAQFAQTIEMRNAGVTIPDHFVIESSSLTRKNEIAEAVKQMTGFGEQTPEQQQIEQLTQQIAIQNAQLELQTAAAQIEKIMADAMLSQAKAEATLMDAHTDAYEAQTNAQYQHVNLVAQMQKALAGLQNKLELAQMHINNKTQLTQYERTSKFAETMLKERPVAGGTQNG